MSTSSLPYNLPKNEKEALHYLAKILNIPAHHLKGDTVKISKAMAGTLMYRQLDRIKRMEVIQLIHSLQNNHLKSILIVKCTDVLVNPQWGEWSLTKEELTKLLSFHNNLNRWSSLLGANPGAYGIGGSAWSIIKQGTGKGNIIVLIGSIALMGIHEFSYKESQKYSNEQGRRL